MPLLVSQIQSEHIMTMGSTTNSSLKSASSCTSKCSRDTSKI